MDVFRNFAIRRRDLSDFKKTYKKNNRLETIPKDSFPVKCLNGTFLGKEEENIISYKGIPFAKPPIKNLRWKPPLDCDNSDDIFEAFTFQKSPVQIPDEGEVSSFYEIGEDCLYLNIWKNNDNEKNKPVLVFIHGGGFGLGGTVDPIYSGHNFVKGHKDIIFVSITYRVSILGFLDLTQIKGGENYKESPNLGLYDQIQALKWINKNIENFGGDKNNVTIVGESAGAFFVTVLPLIKGAKGLFKRVISQSGSFSWAITREQGKGLVERLKSEVKKKRKEEVDVDYLINLSEEEIINLNSKLNIYCVPPMRDGYTIPIDCYGEIERGAYDGLDIIIGTNADEVKYWVIEFGSHFVYRIAITLLVENILSYRIEKNGYELFNEFKKYVKGDFIEQFLSDLFFRVPAVKIAQLHSKNKGNAYLYYWTYPTAIPNLGACHSCELSYVFKNLDYEKQYDEKKINYKLAEVSQSMWANFARNGNPSTEDYKWEKYDSKNDYYMVFGKEIELKTNLFAKERNELLLPLIDNYLSYDYSHLSFNIPIVRKGIFIFLTILVIILSILVKKYYIK